MSFKPGEGLYLYDKSREEDIAIVANHLLDRNPGIPIEDIFEEMRYLSPEELEELLKRALRENEGH